MVAFHHRTSHLAHPLQADFGIGVVTNHVSETDKPIAISFQCIRNYGFEGFQICVNIAKNRKPHEAQHITKMRRSSSNEVTGGIRKSNSRFPTIEKVACQR